MGRSAPSGKTSDSASTRSKRVCSQRHVADLVQEQGAPIGLRDQSLHALALAAGEAARRVAEQFAFDQALRNRCAVDGHEGLRGARAVGVQSARQDLLAGPGLAADQQVHVAVDQPLRLIDQPAHHRVVAEQPVECILPCVACRAAPVARQGRRLAAVGVCRHRAGCGRAPAPWRDHDALELLAAVRPAERHRLRRAAARHVAQRVHADVQQLRERLPHEIGRTPAEASPGAGVGAAHDTVVVEREHHVTRHLDQPGHGAQPQHGVPGEAAQEIGVLDHLRVHRRQVLDQVLALARFGRVQGRHIQHAEQLPVGCAQWRRGAGQRDVRGIEMLGLVAGDRGLLDQAGAHAAGAGVGLVPVGADGQAGRLELRLGSRVADVVDGDAIGIGQQQHVAQVGDAAVQVLHAGARDAHEAVHALLVVTHQAGGQDAGRRRARRVQSVLLHAACPGLVEDCLRSRAGDAGCCGRADPDHVVDVT
jgi:hypothetical protein